MGQNKQKNVTMVTNQTGAKRAPTCIVLAILLSIFTALCIPPIIKEMALFSGVVTLLCTIIHRKRLQTRFTLIGVALLLLTAMTGLSTFYAPDRALALPEFCSLFIGFCIFILFLIFASNSKEQCSDGLLVIALSTATTSLVSIDLLSTRLLFGAFSTITGFFTTGYDDVYGVESGIRMTSLYSASNVFAGIVGIGVLLSLGLAITTEKKDAKLLALASLYINALAFILAFSMGATGVIAIAFIAMLLLTKNESRIPLLVLMVETLIFTLLSAVPIFATSFVTWTSFQPIPLLCTVVGGALFCAVHLRLGQVIATKLNQYSKAATAAVGAVFALAVIFAIVAYNWTGATTLGTGEKLRRSAYPEGGTYTLSTQSNGTLNVTIESQNKEDTLNHTGTIIYKGSADGATFDVPDDSMVVYFNFSATEQTDFQAATLKGEGDSIALKLGYKLLPGFMANRLQGLWANENAIQRTAFFEDGLKIFKTSPIFGRGVSAFESLYGEVQQYTYGTRYVHNHYIQVMLETGIIGLILFSGLLVVSAFALIRLRKRDGGDPLLVTLMACLLFMAGHAMAEVVFSMGTYLVVSMAVFGAMACVTRDVVAVPESSGKGSLTQIVWITISVFMSIWVLLIGCNRAMPIVIQNSGQARFLENLQMAATLDRFDGDDFRYSCIVLATQYQEADMIAQANLYAAHLLPNETSYKNLERLASFYLTQGNMDDARIALDRAVMIDPDDFNTWEDCFDILWTGEKTVESSIYIASIADFYATFVSYNAAHGNTLVLLDSTLAQINDTIH